MSLAAQRHDPDKYGPDFSNKARAKAVAMAMFFWFLLYPGLCLRWVKLGKWTNLWINGTKASYVSEVRAAYVSTWCAPALTGRQELSLCRCHCGL